MGQYYYDNETIVFDGLQKPDADEDAKGKLGPGTYYYVIELKTGDDDLCLDKKNFDYDCDGYFILVE